MKSSGNQTAFKWVPITGKIGLLITTFLILVSCAALPSIQPFRLPLREGHQTICGHPFVTQKWQLVHSVKAVLPNGLPQSMIGTVIVSPEQNTVHCVLLSIEGLVLLDVVYDQQVIVNRAVPPFDESEMAAGLIRDVQLLLLKPAGILFEFGTMEDQSTICRYRNEEGNTIDVIVHPDRNWEIKQYGSSDRLERSARGLLAEEQKTADSGEMIPQRLELTAHGFVGYKLSLDLLEAIPLSSQGLSE